MERRGVFDGRGSLCAFLYVTYIGVYFARVFHVYVDLLPSRRILVCQSFEESWQQDTEHTRNSTGTRPPRNLLALTVSSISPGAKEGTAHGDA